MKIAFLCDTPYQVLNCINYCYHATNVHEVDLYLGHQFTGSYELEERIKQEKVVRNVYGFKDYLAPMQVVHYLRRMKQMIFPKSFLKHALIDSVSLSEKRYDQIFISVPTMFAIALKRTYPEASLFYYDDGMGSYYDNIFEKMERSPQGKLCKMFGIRLDDMKPQALYINNPQFCQSTMTSNILPLPPLKQAEPEFLSMVYRVFDMKRNEMYDRYRMIYLSQPNDAGSREVEHQADLIMKALQPYEKQCMVRPHPRQKNLDTGRLTVDRIRSMWELLCGDQITDNHILIGTYSTAQLTPKLFFQKEPYVIFLYQLEGITSGNGNIAAMEELIENLREGYQHPEKVMVVKTVSQLQKEIEGLLNES